MEAPSPAAEFPGGIKRKRSPSAPSSYSTTTSAAAAAAASGAAPAAGPVTSAKTPKPNPQMSINYLARQSAQDLPLLSKEDSLPGLLQLLSAYTNVLDRNESLASNLGATPLGPILIKRFERCFEAPPKIVASHHKGSSAGNPDDAAHTITWLEVIEFARSHPSQFTLSTFSEGRRVCQFYYPQKQLRVQISEEDFLFINSGRCQDLIPPLPIWEDEEKEVTTCDVLEARLKELTNAADMVAARTRQLGHRLKNRRAAILERRAEGGIGTPAKAVASQTTPAPSSSVSAGGFVAVNAGAGRTTSDTVEPGPSSSNQARDDLLRQFESLPHNQGQTRPHSRVMSVTGLPEPMLAETKASEPKLTRGDTLTGGAVSTSSSLSPVPTSTLGLEHTPYANVEATASTARTPNPPPTSSHAHRLSSGTTGASAAPASNNTTPKHNFSRPLPPALENSQPFRPLCQAHMDSLPRGQRVLPPCDRCRRLRMDCVKNLTSCAGCTKKHARCHWRDVTRDELGALDHLMDAADAVDAAISPNQEDPGPLGSDFLAARLRVESDDDDSNPLEDLEALAEKDDDEAAELMRRRHHAGHHHPQNEWEESLISIEHAHLLEHEPDDGKDTAQTRLLQLAEHKHHHSSSATNTSGGSDDTKASVDTKATSITTLSSSVGGSETRNPSETVYTKISGTVATTKQSSMAEVESVSDETAVMSTAKTNVAGDAGGDEDAATPIANPETRPVLPAVVGLGGFRAVNDIESHDQSTDQTKGWRPM